MEQDVETQPEESEEERDCARAAFFDRMEETARRVNLSPEEAEALVDEAIRWVRSQRAESKSEE